jgi:hypothetical protein
MLILILFISCKRYEMINWNAILNNIKTVVVYDLQPDISNKTNYDNMNFENIICAEFNMDVFKKIIINVKYKKGSVVWKCGNLAVVNLNNNQKIFMAISCYGCFFKIIGKNGYYYFENNDYELFKNEYINEIMINKIVPNYKLP